MAVNLIPTIEKLKASNYATWQKDIKFLLLEKNCWDIVIEEEKLPKLPESGEKSGAQQLISDFKARERTALTTLYLNVSPEYRGLIDECTSPVDAWKTLRKHFQPDSRAHHMQLFNQLFQCFILPDEKISVYASRLSRVVEQLKSIGEPIEDVYICFQFLRFLPEQFESAVQYILRWEKKLFTFKNITEELVAEETRLELRAADKVKFSESSVEVQNTQAKVIGFKRSYTCFRCGRKGHFKKDCKVNLSKYPPPQLPNSSNVNVDNSYSKFSNAKFSKNVKGSGTIKAKNSKSGTRNFSSYLLVQSSFSSSGGDSCWAFDTAASHHFCKNLEFFDQYTPISGESMNVAVDGVNFPIIGKGIVKMKLNNRIYTFKDVLYSPKLRKNLISGPKMDQNGASFKGSSGKVTVFGQGGEKMLTASLENGIYCVYPKVLKNSGGHGYKATASVANVNTIKFWHSRFAHISPDLLVGTSKSSGVSGLPKLKHQDFFCEPCKVNKQRRISFKPLQGNSSKAPLERVCMDVWGPINVKGRNGERFFLSIVDEFSRRAAIYPLKDKTQVFGIFERHIARAERSLGKRLKFLKTDNGGEFDNDQFTTYCDKQGVNHEFTNQYTPEQNGICERLNQTALNCVRTVLADSGLPLKFWPEAVIYFSYTWNRICHKGQSKTPFELYTCRKPSIRHLKPFGLVAYVGVPKQKRHKLDPKAKIGILVGYALRTKGYRIWLEQENKIIETINVSFSDSLYGQRSGAVLGSFPVDFELGRCDDENPVEQISFEPVEVIREPNSDPEVEKDTPEPPAVVPTSPSKITWKRLPKPRTIGNRVDIYYCPEGSQARFKSLKEIKCFCENKGITFKPEIFDFSGKNLFEGIVGEKNLDSPSPSTSKTTA